MSEDKDDEEYESTEDIDIDPESILQDVLNDSDAKGVLDHIREEDTLRLYMDKYRGNVTPSEKPKKSFFQRVKETFKDSAKPGMNEEDDRRLKAIKPQVLIKRNEAIRKLDEYKQKKIDKYLKQYYDKNHPGNDVEKPTFQDLSSNEKEDFKKQYKEKMDRNDEDAAYHLALGDKDYREAALKNDSNNSTEDKKSLKRAIKGYDAIINNPDKLNQWRVTTAIVRNPKTIAGIMVPMAVGAVFMSLQVVGALLVVLALQKAATAIGITLQTAGAVSTVKDVAVLKSAVYEKIDHLLQKDVSEEKLKKGEEKIEEALTQDQKDEIKKLKSMLQKLEDKNDEIWRREAKRQILFGENDGSEIISRPVELRSSLDILAPSSDFDSNPNIASKNLGELNSRINNISEYLKTNESKETKELVAVFDDIDVGLRKSKIIPELGRGSVDERKSQILGGESPKRAKVK